MVYYYDQINHTNLSDNEEEILRLTSSREEPKVIESINILSYTNKGVLRAYIEREKILEVPVGYGTIVDVLEIKINADLLEGETFKITLQNETSGVNTSVQGFVKYQIK